MFTELMFTEHDSTVSVY